jgi:FkbM family methyltransferase
VQINNNLIYDVGHHKGEDTAYYLKKGFHVVTFEADPDLISLSKKKFSKEISDGSLTIVEGAIVENPKKGEVVRFYKNNKNTVWGTVVKEWSERNEQLGAKSEIIEVPVIDFKQCLIEYGIPYYMKIDIEGMDMVCLEALKELDIKPAYISIESDKVSIENIKKELDIFDELGYNAFQIVNQGNITKRKEKKSGGEGKYLNQQFQSGSTGYFGKDFSSPWSDKNTALKKYERIFLGYKLWGNHSKISRLLLMKLLRRTLQFISGKAIPGWFDTHARHKSIV